MKRPAAAPAITPDNPHSAAYLAARREWNERYGEYIAQARTWRMVAFGALGVAGIAVGGVAWIGAQNRIVPYVVQVDKLGDAVAINRADIVSPADPRVISWQLARWVENVRSVYADVAAERHTVIEAFSVVADGSDASSKLKEWFGANDPFARAKDELVSVTVDPAQPISGNTWRIEWTEERHARGGQSPPLQHWQATIDITVNPPKSDAEIRANPTGMYINRFFWSQK